MGGASGPVGAVSRVPSWASRQVPLFLLGTFGWAWSLWGYWVLAMPAGGLRISAAFVVCALLGGFAPSLSAIVTRLVTGGREGVAELLRPLLMWRVRPGFYAFASVTMPLLTILSVTIQSILFGPLGWPEPALLAMAAVWPIAAALGEEIGWRGLLLPALNRRFALLPAALLVGLLWGAWHLPADFIAFKGYGELFPLAFLINGPLVLTGHSLIMAWLWKRTQGSLLIAVLYHWSITGSAILSPTVESGWVGLAASAIGAGLVWTVALALWLPPWRRGSWATRVKDVQTK